MSNQIDAPEVAAFYTMLEALENKLFSASNDLEVLQQHFTNKVLPLVLESGGVVEQPKPKATLYSQRDPKWSQIRLGSSNTTIGGYGCLMTCAASMLTDAGREFTPLTLNTYLINNGGYSGGNHFVFGSLDPLAVVKFYKIVECSNIPAPVQQFDEIVQMGDFVIVKVDFDPATIAIDEHWVRYIGGGYMLDPWNGDIAPIVPRYRGKDAAEAILRAVIYKRSK